MCILRGSPHRVTFNLAIIWIVEEIQRILNPFRCSSTIVACMIIMHVMNPSDRVDLFSMVSLRGRVLLTVAR